MRHWFHWLIALVPIALAVVIVAILAGLGVIEWEFSIQDADSVLIAIGVVFAVIVAMLILLRASVAQMQRDSLRIAHELNDAERSRFLRRLDHELKNPLMGIKMAIANLATMDNPAERRRLSSDIDSQIMRMTRLVAELRRIAELGAHPLEVEPINIASLLDEVYELAAEDPAVEDRRFEVSIPRNLPTLSVDHDLLLTAVYNLVNNAIKFTRPRDRIALRAHVEEEALVIEVEDTGIGIAPDDQPFVWDELYRAPSVHDIPGSGVGLALVKLIVQKHGGAVTLTSAPNAGTTVRMTLPLQLKEPKEA